MAYGKSWQRSSPDDARAKVDAALALIKGGVEKLATSEDWLRMLGNMSKFHRYSFSNQMLIAMQRPDATRVAGFETWKKLGRFVKKGAKGIQILAPRTYRKTATVEVRDPKTGEKREESKEVAGVYFRSAHVFDISDTDVLPGAKAPLLLGDLIKTLDGQNETAFQVAEVVGAWLKAHNISLVYEAMDANGYYDASRKLIALNKDRPRFQQAKTLIHEVAHLLLHTPEDLRGLEFQHKHSKSRSEIMADAREVEAESTAFVVLHAVGVDSGDYSFGYVTHWSDGKPEMVSKVASRVRDAAMYLLDSVLGVGQDDAGEDTESEPVAGRSDVAVERPAVRNNPDFSLPRMQMYRLDPAIYALETGIWETDGGETRTTPWGG